jgi:hypothetical protein
MSREKWKHRGVELPSSRMIRSVATRSFQENVDALTAIVECFSLRRRGYTRV